MKRGSPPTLSTGAFLQALPPPFSIWPCNPTCGPLSPRWSAGFILAVALLLRLPFLIRPAELSDDIYRYLWDGLQTLSGSNPYAAAPANVHPTHAAAEGVRRLVNHAELVTIYP